MTVAPVGHTYPLVKGLHQPEQPWRQGHLPKVHEGNVCRALEVPIHANALGWKPDSALPGGITLIEQRLKGQYAEAPALLGNTSHASALVFPGHNKAVQLKRPCRWLICQCDSEQISRLSNR
eukprot:scaffold195833_cov18-Prasinocladus_malaysianus.AAC.1